MMNVGQELFLGENFGYFQVFDIQNLEITHTLELREIGDIFDIIAIEDSELLLLAG